MPGPRKLDPSSSPRALLGAELRHRREEAGLSQAELGAPLFVSGSFIGQLESGVRRMQMDQAEKFDEVLGADGFFVRNCAALKKSKYPDHFAEAAEAEARAITIKEYAPQLIPGLLQSETYARAVFREYQPTAVASAIDDLVAARLERAQLLADPTQPMLWAVLDEAVLRRTVGGPGVMSGALHHVATLVQQHRIIVQVLPFSALRPCRNGRRPQAHGLLRCASTRLLGRARSGTTPGRSRHGQQVRTDLRSGGGQRDLTGSVPGLDRVGGGGLRK